MGAHHKHHQREADIREQLKRWVGVIDETKTGLADDEILKLTERALNLTREVLKCWVFSRQRRLPKRTTFAVDLSG